MLSDQLIWYDDAAYYISFRQHSETDLVTGHVSLAHHLQHGRLDKLPLSIKRLINFLDALHMQGRLCTPIITQHNCMRQPASSRIISQPCNISHATSPFGASVAPQVHGQGTCQGSC